MNDIPLRAAATTSSHLRAVLAAAAAWLDGGTDVALALVVGTRGSTYRKSGALAVVGADGGRVGALSGGCLEPEIERVARESLADGSPRLIELDTHSDEDLLFGSGSGCRGSMRVLLLPIRAGDAADSLFAALVRTCGDGVGLTLALALSAPWLGAWRGRWTERGAGPRGSSSLELALDNLLEGPRGTVEHDVDGAACEFAAIEIAPPPRVLLLGAGPEAPVLARLLREMGSFVDVADHRPGLCNAQRLPAADRLLVARPRAAAEAWSTTPCAAAIVMTHQASTDAEALSALAPCAVGYIGLLGPRARSEELLAQLDPETRAALVPRLRGPAGVDLGGEGPEAIALSIAAGLQRYFSARRDNG